MALNALFDLAGAVFRACSHGPRALPYASVFRDKPCFMVSASGGILGGVRPQAHLKYILNGMLARVFPAKEVIVTRANSKVKDGLMVDEDTLAFAEAEIGPFVDSPS